MEFWVWGFCLGWRFGVTNCRASTATTLEFRFALSRLAHNLVKQAPVFDDVAAEITFGVQAAENEAVGGQQLYHFVRELLAVVDRIGRFDRRGAAIRETRHRRRRYEVYAAGSVCRSKAFRERAFLFHFPKKKALAHLLLS